jgi:hypothetical protein
MNPILIAGIIAGGLYVGSMTVKGVKKVNHQIGCVTKTGHKCPKPKPAGRQHK